MADTPGVLGAKRIGVPSPEGNPKLKEAYGRGAGKLSQRQKGASGNETLIPVAPWGAIRIQILVSQAGVLNLAFCDQRGVEMGPKLESVGALTLTGLPADTNTMTLDTKVYTVQTVLTNVDGNILIGATAEAMIDNIVAAIMLEDTPEGLGAGDVYAAAMTLHPTVHAAKTSATVMGVEAKSGGTSGDAIASTETLTNASFGAGTLGSGADGNITVDETVIQANVGLELDIPGVHAAAPEHIGEPYLKVSVAGLAAAANVSLFDFMGASW